MKKLTSILNEYIEKQIGRNKTNILRVEGIDNPIIYKDICMYFKDKADDYSFIAKLTIEKYHQFIDEKKGAWKKSIEILHQGNNLEVCDDNHISDDYCNNSYIDFNGAITKWRNESANISEENKTIVILLLGTELAPDKGGLEDFCTVSPREIIDVFKKDYSSWFNEILFKNDLQKPGNKDSINAIYKALFSGKNVDLFKMSNLIDEISDSSFTTINELIEYIFNSLERVWGVPSIYDINYIPKATILKRGKPQNSQIIIDALNFINRSEDMLSKLAEEKLRKKFDKYAQEHKIEILQPFPDNMQIYQSYNEFEESIIHFYNGKNVEQNRGKLLKVDFSIIRSIIGTKIGVEPKKSIPTLTGEPIEAYSHMFSYILSEYYNKYKKIPSSYTVIVKKVSLSNCVSAADKFIGDDDSVDTTYSNICCFLGGILGYFTNSNIFHQDEQLIFSYENGTDPFDYNNYDEIKSKVKATGKWGDPCKIELCVTANKDSESLSCDYKWVFYPYSSWNNAFTYLNSLINKPGDSYILPTLVSCTNMSEYIGCESEDEFYAQLDQMRDVVLFDKHKSEISRYFSNTDTANMFDALCSYFTDWAKKLTSHGLYNSLNELHIVVQKYSELMEYIQKSISTYTSQQKDKLHLFINSFIITSNNNVCENGDIKEAIFPSYNPVMLEKLDAKQLFILEGFKEIISSHQENTNKTIEYKDRLNNLIQLSTITQGTDTIISKQSTYLTCKNSWGYYGVYYGNKTPSDIISSNALSSSIITDDEDASAMLRVSPESNIIIRNVLDYIKTFPARVDGLKIAFISPTDMQHIVAAVHQIAKALEKQGTKATINIKIICLNSNKNSAGYLRRWLDSYFDDEKLVKVNTFLRYMSTDGSSNIDELSSLLHNHDLCFAYNILTPTDVNFTKIAEMVEAIDQSQSKFPMSFTPDAISFTQGKTRKINISHFQFISSKYQTQVSHMLGYPDNEEGVYRAIRSLELCEIEENIIEKAHNECKWVVCIDPAIDRYMLQSSNRKVIGFTTGEGCYGELNVTVSAREDILKDIKDMLRKRIMEKFTNWESIRLQKAADYCVELSKEMDGSRILKALNPFDYEIHNFLAYILTLQLLKLTDRNNDYIIRALISLDSYKHWFVDSFDNGDNKRPDFMLIEIPNTPENRSLNSKLKINIKIIECKMGFENQKHLEKAREQLEKGIRTMSINWDPNDNCVMHRYWLNQLYRAIIFSPLNIADNDSEYQTVKDKIFGILAGNYEIEWTGDIFAFWLDVDSETQANYDINYSSSLEAELKERNITLSSMQCHTAGQMFIQKMLLPSEERTAEFVYNDIDNETHDNYNNYESDETVESQLPSDYANSMDDSNPPVDIIADEKSIPEQRSLYKPYLSFLSDENSHTRQDSLQWMRTKFNISYSDLKLLYDNGHLVYETKMDGVITLFRKHGILRNSVTSTFSITSFGINVYEHLMNREDDDILQAIDDLTASAPSVEVNPNIPITNVEHSETSGSRTSEIAQSKNVSSVRLLLGEDMRTKEKYFWEYGNKELNNRHLLINGNSGCGKTYCIQALLMESALQGISSVVFDYTGGFTNSKLDPIFKQALGDKIQQRIVRTAKIPMNPFKKHDIQLDEDLFVPEDDVDVATKISSIFKTVYKFGDQQKSALYSAVLSGLRKHETKMSFKSTVEELENIDSANAKSVLSKIRPFTDINPFTIDEQFDWGDIRDNDGIVYVIQLSGYDRDTQILLTELLLWDIWSYCVKSGDESKPFTIVLDEAQNLSHAADSPSAKILTEGRKFGLSGWYATQFMKPQLSDDEIQRLQQAGQKLYFCPPDDGVMTVAKNIDINAQNSKEWAEHLKRLKKGECVTCGSMIRNNKWTKYEPKIIKITSLQERLNNDN